MPAIKIIIFGLAAYFITVLATSTEQPQLNPETGLKIDKGYEIVEAYCIGCHTGKKVSLHSATREGWKATVGKMQKIGQWTFDPLTENLILNYLSKNYPEEDLARKE
ncbi:MAG: hypothetical protein V3V31_08720 [Methylococcales bacterium]